MMEGESIGSHHIHVRLDELTEATILGTLPAPHLLDLVALEGEVQLARVL